MAMRLYDITTGTGDFIANGVVSHNCFARPTHTYLGLQRRPRLREGDRRQGQRAGGAARRAGAAVVEGRARRDGDQHRPVPVGRGALQAHARDLGGDARRGQPVLGADEVAAAAARPRPDEGDRRASPTSARTSRCRRSTRRRGGRASRTRRNPRARLEAVAELNRAGHPDRRPGRAADAGHQRRPRARCEEILQAAAEAGATGIGGIGLHLRGEVRGVFMEWLRVLPAGPRRALRGALCTRRVPAAGRAGADRRARAPGAHGDADAAVGAFRREPGRDYEPMWPPESGHRAATAGAGARADQAVLIGGWRAGAL